MNNLYQQLNYNWERGFYSVIGGYKKSKFGIISTKSKDGFRWSSLCESIEEAKMHVGEFGYMDEVEIEHLNRQVGLEIVDTIYPSELMGKGFQVGDKVTCETLISRGPYTITESYFPLYSMREVTGDPRTFSNVYHHLLKPVLPAEEKKEGSGEYHLSININGLKIIADDLLPPNTFIVDNGIEAKKYTLKDGKFISNE